MRELSLHCQGQNKGRQQMRSSTYALGCLSIIVALVLTGCGRTDMKAYQQTLDEAEFMNSSSDLGMQYLQASRLTPEQARQFNDDQPELELTEDGSVVGYYFPYPKLDGDRLLTQVVIRGGDEYHVFGIHLGDDVETAASILEQRGYQEVESTMPLTGTETREFHKYDVIIKLVTKNDSFKITLNQVLTNTH